MSRHLPVLMAAVPLGAAVAVPMLAFVAPRAARAVFLAALSACHLASLFALRRVLGEGPWRYELGGWPPPWGIEYVVDALSGGMAVLISFMALVTGLYLGPEARRRPGIAGTAQQSLHLLLTAGLLGIVLTGDAFNLYVFLEISALAAYGLLAGGGARSMVAVFRYLLVGTIAATFYLLGVGYLYALTGTLNMADIAARLPGAGGTAPALAALALIVVGMAIKVALFPLHGWLPDAYSCAPASAAAFVASVMSKVGVYVLLRVLFLVFGAGEPVGRLLDVLGGTAAVAVVAGSVMALAQTDLRRMLAYSSVGQMGYIVLGFGLGNAAGLTGALLHAANHSVMKACLFLSGGNVLARARTARISEYDGMARRFPLTLAAFTVAAVSMIGLPPAGGFFSKWYLVMGALERGRWLYVAAIVASSLLTAVYMFRVVEGAYFRAPKGDAGGDSPRRGSREAPLSMLVPVLVLAAAVLALGLFNQPLVDAVVAPAVAVLLRR